ncbi:maleylpyruvate isomerase N-terminal domain-containing protein [Agromyces sp. SYSU T00266]|uniref:maleylpyruvate isomerase N-terminal domain-containing protein n=1 Tax=Agromyces zhanjiangensis TaxID=3158562 RepID=UPI003395C404
MSSLADLHAVVDAFAREAALTDPEAQVRSAIWPTAGRIVDHLGTIQRWAAEQARTGAPADRRAFRRPEGADRAAWFLEGAQQLTRTLEGSDPERVVPVLYGATGTVRFWQRRMAHEATKHLWDLRTARDADPRFPPEVDPLGRADAVDEFGDVFMAEARRRGIDPLAGPVALVATDTADAWRVSPQWVLEREPADAASAPPVAATISAEVGDLALLLWERADLVADDGRFRVDGDVDVATALATTPVHL